MGTNGKQAEKQPYNPAETVKEFRFPKGTSGNPKGRPKKENCLTSLLRELLEGDPNQVRKRWKGVKSGKRKMTGAQNLAIALYNKAVAGDLKAIQMIYERTEGKVPQPLEHTGNGGEAIEFNVDPRNILAERIAHISEQRRITASLN